jgi:hypothetical protein
MRRAEADGVAWFLAQRAARGRQVGPRSPGLFWTAHTPQTAIAEALPAVVGAIAAAMARLGDPVAVEEVSAALGTAEPEILPYDPAGLTRLAGLFAERRPGRLSLRLHAPRGGGGPDRAVDLGIAVSFYDHAVWNGDLHPSLGPAGWCDEHSPVIDEIAGSWSRALAEICAVTKAVWGCVGVDHWAGMQPPYDTYFPIGYNDGELLADRHPRGYYWSNVLSAEHIRALGGLNGLTERCKALELNIDVLSAPSDRMLVLVRSPVPVSQFTDERLAAVRDLLDPILIHRPYRWYAGPPLRVFKQPGTAFRPIPPETRVHLPVFDDDEPLPEGDDW